MTFLAEYTRKAAHGKHRCGWCWELIAQGEEYRDQRIADDGTVYTWREHIACANRFWPWWIENYGDEVINPHESFLQMLEETTDDA